MKMILFLLVSITAKPVLAGSWRPNERFLAAVRFVESSHGKYTHGDNGASLGDFQISEAAWFDVTSWRKAQGLGTYDYHPYVLNRTINQLYAADYLTILYGELRKKLKRPPVPAEIYAAYNMGLSSFAQCNYSLERINPLTAKKCRQIKLMMTAP